MKKYLSKVIPAFIIISMFLFLPVGVITDLNADENNDPGVGYLENILFEKLSRRIRRFPSDCMEGGATWGC